MGLETVLVNRARIRYYIDCSGFTIKNYIDTSVIFSIGFVFSQLLRLMQNKTAVLKAKSSKLPKKEVTVKMQEELIHVAQRQKHIFVVDILDFEIRLLRSICLQNAYACEQAARRDLKSPTPT